MLLGNCASFRAMLCEWPEQHRQHDVAEFAQFVLVRVPSLLYTWEIRMQIEGVTTPVHVPLPCMPLPLTLPLETSTPERGIALQTLVANWSDSEQGIAALTAPASAIIFLQVGRFMHQRGVVVKNHAQVILPADRALRVPCFSGDGLSVVQVEYCITALVLHRGDSLLHGHYVTAWWQGTHLTLSDDARQLPMTGGLEARDLEEAYLVAAVRES